MYHLYLNFSLVPDAEVGGLQKVIISVQKGQTGAPETTISSELQFYGATYEYLKGLFIDSPSAGTNHITAKLVDDCCGNGWEFIGIIDLSGIDWCSNECWINAKIKKKNDGFTCLKSTPIGDNWNGFQTDVNRNHPRLLYCIELRPNWLQDVILIFGMIFNVWEYIQVPMIAIISIFIQLFCAIINAFGSIGINLGTCPPDLADGILSEYLDMIKQMNTFMIGCGRFHPSPKVSSYIQNVCDKCGLSFESSILTDSNSEYANSVLLSADVKKGILTFPLPPYIQDNEPVMTLDMFLDILKPVFNAEWRLQGTLLRFERHDLLIGTVTAFDFTGDDKSKLQGGICYSWNGTNKPAYDNIAYQKDAIDYVGNEAATRYNDIIEYNIPINPAFSGERKKDFEFATSRFRDDGIERDVLSSYQNNIFFGNVIQAHNNVLIMAQATTFLPKLLIWDGLDYVNAKVKIYPTPAGYETAYADSNEAPPPKLFNYPYFIDAVFNDAQKNLWEFHKIDDPRSTFIKNLNYDLTFKYTCADLLELDLFSSAIVGQGTGTIDGWEIDAFNRTITLKGTV